MCALDFQIFINIPHIKRLYKAFGNLWDNLFISSEWYSSVTLVKLRRKIKKPSEYFVRIWRIFFCFLIFEKGWKLQRCSCFRRNIESFHRCCPTAFSHAISAKFLLEPNGQNSTWKMLNVAIFHISVALNINFYKVKSPRDLELEI